jgi:murein DD-endopeptidase MepM/ murein hydrolase activator NlpD
MSEKPKNQSLSEKLKNTKVNRAAVLTAIVLIAALAVIISVTVATNRSKKNNGDPIDTPSKTTQNTVPTTPSTQSPSTEAPTPTTPAHTTGSAQVEDKLPSFILPVNGVLSKGHDATLQVYSNTMKDYRVHLGVDIVTEANAPVYAAADGKISKIWEDTLMGYCIAVKHSGDCYTIYKNLSETVPEGISEGVSVRAGQLIGSVGESAMVEVAEEPHLHFEMTVADLSVDPLEYFDDKILDSLNIDASHGE